MAPGTLKIVTTSWDDGHPADQRLADMLSRHGIAGTFYVPQANHPHAVMNASQIRALAAGFEIGAHTLNHVRLTRVDRETSWREILGSRIWLQDVLGAPPRSFCYPGGECSPAIRDQAAQAGFQLARTTELLSTRLTNPLRMPTTLQLFRHTRSVYLRNAARNVSVQNFGRLCGILLSRGDILRSTEHILDGLEARGGIFHLWGHSWEIEEHGLWGMLGDILRLLSSRRGFLHATNGAMFRLLNGETRPLPVPAAELITH